MLNSIAKVEGLEKNEITVSERIELIIESDAFNTKYLNTKEQHMEHIFETVNLILS